MPEIVSLEDSYMGQPLNISDETSTGQLISTTTIQLVSEQTTAREIIIQRVRQEVKYFNHKNLAEPFKGLIQPLQIEHDLNNYQGRQSHSIDVDEQINIAIKSFNENGFFMLVDGSQVATLDQAIGITDSTKVSFIKLVPLVGG